MCTIFIDYKSAYNTVNRSKLWEIISKLNIFNANELEFLKLLHDKIHFVVNNEKYYFRDGVGQGLTTSPGLFNIYMEEVMK